MCDVFLVEVPQRIPKGMTMYASNLPYLSWSIECNIWNVKVNSFPRVELLPSSVGNVGLLRGAPPEGVTFFARGGYCTRCGGALSTSLFSLFFSFFTFFYFVDFENLNYLKLEVWNSKNLNFRKDENLEELKVWF